MGDVGDYTTATIPADVGEVRRRAARRGLVGRVGHRGGFAAGQGVETGFGLDRLGRVVAGLGMAAAGHEPPYGGAVGGGRRLVS